MKTERIESGHHTGGSFGNFNSLMQYDNQAKSIDKKNIDNQLPPKHTFF